MGLSKAGASFLAAIILSFPGQASGDFLEEFSSTRALAYETLRVLRGVALPAEEKEKKDRHQFHASRLQRKRTKAEIEDLIEKKAASYGINPSLVKSVVTVESGYDVSARSRKGAMGLMQLMPVTASELKVINPWDPEENLDGGIQYLAGLLREFRDVKDALVAYNAGPEVVRRKMQIPEETRQYVHLVLSHFRRSRWQNKEMN